MKNKFKVTSLWASPRLRLLWILYLIGLLIAALIVIFFQEISGLVVVGVVFPALIIVLQKLETGLTATNVRIRGLSRDVNYSADLAESLSKRVKRMSVEPKSIADRNESGRDYLPTDSSGETKVQHGDNRKEILDLLDFLVRTVGFSDTKDSMLSPAQSASIESIIDKIAPKNVFVIGTRIPSFLGGKNVKLVDVDDFSFKTLQVPAASIFILESKYFEKMRNQIKNWEIFFDSAFLVTGTEWSADTIPPAGFEEIHPVTVSYGIRLFYPTQRTGEPEAIEMRGFH